MATAASGLSADDRRRWGRSVRKMVPRSIHAFRLPRPAHADPVATIVAQNRSRLAALVPERNARMARSPVAFFLGNPKVMADDLAGTLSSGLAVQICGDAHLANFGLFDAAGPTPVFEIIDFLETTLGPWEWDVKRLAVSFAVTARQHGASTEEARAVAQKPVRAYRKAMARFAQMSYLDVWNARLRSAGARAVVEGSDPGKRHIEGESTSRMPRSLIVDAEGVPRIVARPPDVVPLWGPSRADRPDSLIRDVEDVFTRYRHNLAPSRRVLLERYEPVEAAATALGIAGVGVPTFVLLLSGRDARDRLLLELRQTSAAALGDEFPAIGNPGQRVVSGQRLMQAVDDPFLGWARDESGKHYVVRSLPETRVTWDVERGSPKRLRRYAKLCGRALARAHARSGDVPAIAGYLGESDAFDRAIADFAESYTDQNERDYALFLEAISSGRVPVTE